MNGVSMNRSYSGGNATGGYATKIPSAEELRKKSDAIYGPGGKSRILADGGFVMLGLRPVDVRIGGEYEYDKEDSLKRLGSLKLKMDGDFSQKPTQFGTTETGFSMEDDLFWSGIDLNTISYDSPDRLEQGIDFMASRFAVLRARALKEGSGVPNAMTEAAIQKYGTQLAANFADIVSGIFQENGVTGERDRIYQSVLAALEEQTTAYEGFLEKAGDYGKIDSAQEGWLETDSAYLSARLRDAMAEATAPKTAKAEAATKEDLYSLGDLVKMEAFTKELKQYATPTSGFANAILVGNETEESLGMKLGELKLKGRVFNEKSGVSDRVKDLVNRSIDHFVEKSIDREQAHLDKFKRLQTEAVQGLVARGKHPGFTSADAAQQIAQAQKANATLEQDAIYAIINKIDSVYSDTGDVGKAILDGAALAFENHSKKAQSPEYDGITRYDDKSYYWNNFYRNADGLKTFLDPSVDNVSQATYVPQSAKLDGMISSWNQFMWRTTSSTEALLQKVPFSAYA